MNAPPTSRSRPTKGGTGTTDAAGKPRQSLSDAELAGELASARYGRLAGKVALPELPERDRGDKCTGRCGGLGVAQREFYGEQYGACPCIGDRWPVIV